MGVLFYKHRDFGNWRIKTDVYVAGLWFLVRFGGECDSYVHTLGCLGEKWKKDEKSAGQNRSLLTQGLDPPLAIYERDESWVLKQLMS